MSLNWETFIVLVVGLILLAGLLLVFITRDSRSKSIRVGFFFEREERTGDRDEESEP